MNFKRQNVLIKSVCCKFYKNLLRNKKVIYAFEVSIISFMDTAIFASLLRHNLLIIYAIMNYKMNKI